MNHLLEILLIAVQKFTKAIAKSLKLEIELAVLPLSSADMLVCFIRETVRLQFEWIKELIFLKDISRTRDKFYWSQLSNIYIRGTIPIFHELGYTTPPRVDVEFMTSIFVNFIHRISLKTAK